MKRARWIKRFFLPHLGSLQRLDCAYATTLGYEFAQAFLPELLDHGGFKAHLQVIRSCETRLEHLPDLLLGVELLLRVALPAFKVDSLAGLGCRRRVHQLDGSAVGVDLALLQLRRRGEHHGRRLD